MFCIKCQKDIPWCTCADIDKRLKQLAQIPSISIAAKQNMKARRIVQGIHKRAIGEAK